MALSVTKSRITSTRGSDLRSLTVQFNGLLTVLRGWAVGFDGDSGIAATDHVATLEAGASQIGDLAGTALTS